MTAVVVRGDARALPLPDRCADLIVTSVPYWGLRDYSDGGESMPGQIGSEATPEEWLANLADCTREWIRVLKPEGSLFVNCGDKYATRYSSRRGRGRAGLNGDDDTRGRSGQNRTGAGEKSLLGLPWRYALGCTDQLGLILRAEIIWAKPNGLPESVTDRVRRAHEQVFHFTRQPRYYAAVDEIREENSGYFRQNNVARATPDGTRPKTFANTVNPLGKLPGSVWDIPSQPLAVPARLGIDHFAAFPSELPRRIIAGWSPPGVCTACGQGRRPVTDVEHTKSRGGRQWNVLRGVSDPSSMLGWESVKRITGYACACPDTTAPARPALVLDPFCGTGTTMLAASVLGRIGIGVDRSADYCRLAAWRTRDPGERCRVIGAPKPPPVADGQDALFALDAAMGP